MKNAASASDHFSGVSAAAKLTLIGRLFTLLDWLGPEHFRTGDAEAIFRSQSLSRPSAADVMISIQKANISFQAATQVRNRLVSAYQDIMNMPL